MFVYTGQLDVRLWRVGHDETVDDTFRDGLRHSMAEETLDLDPCSILGV